VAKTQIQHGMVSHARVAMPGDPVLRPGRHLLLALRRPCSRGPVSISQGGPSSRSAR
jgi:hypothetical protein